MNKKLMFILSVVLVLVLALPVFVACNETEKVTVTWYDGSNVLRTDEVEKGTVISSWTPTTDDGRVFQKWYAETSKTTEFDFTQAINEDTDIFAGFKAAFEADTRTWCLIGTGMGTLKDSGWKEDAEVEENFKLTKTDDTDVNRFVMEGVVLYADDEFKIREMGTWNSQYGIAYFDGFTAKTDPDDESLVGVVEKDGKTYFKAVTNQYGDPVEKSNAVVVESGIYTLTLETNPGSAAYDKIYFEKTGEAQPITKTHDMYITGTNNGWGAIDAEGSIKMQESGDKATWTAVVVVTEAMYQDWTAKEGPFGEECAAFKVKNAANDKDYGANGDKGNIFLKKGTYMFKYTVATNLVEVEQCTKYYVVGTFLDGAEQVGFAVKDGVTPELTVEGTTATATFTATDVTASYTWIQGGVFAFKVVFVSDLGIGVWYGDPANGGNNFVVAAGTYTVTLDIEAGEVTVTPAEQPQA